MSRLDEVENQIFEVEHFRVKITHKGKDARGDIKGLKDYPREMALKDGKTVEEWKMDRFKKNFPGIFSVEVLNADKSPADGKCFLSTVRKTYPKNTIKGNNSINVSTPEIENRNLEDPNKAYHEALKNGEFKPGITDYT